MATFAGHTVEGVDVTLVLNGLWRVAFVVDELAADDNLVAFLDLCVAFHPEFVLKIEGAVDVEGVGVGTVIRDVEGGVAKLITEGPVVGDFGNLALDVVVLLGGGVGCEGCYEVVGCYGIPRVGERAAAGRVAWLRVGTWSGTWITAFADGDFHQGHAHLIALSGQREATGIASPCADFAFECIRACCGIHKAPRTVFLFAGGGAGDLYLGDIAHGGGDGEVGSLVNAVLLSIAEGTRWRGGDGHTALGYLIFALAAAGLCAHVHSGVEGDDVC